MRALLGALLRAVAGPSLARDISCDLDDERQRHAQRSVIAAALWCWTAYAGVIAYMVWRRSIERCLANGSAERLHAGRSMAALARDVRYTVRSLARDWTFTATILLTLASSIGAATVALAVFTSIVLDAVPGPYAGRIVAIHGFSPSGAARATLLSSPAVADLRTRKALFEAVASYERTKPRAIGQGESRLAQTVLVAPGFFRIYGVQPLAGRWFAAEEGDEGHDRVVVISERLWRQDFGTNPSLVGRSIALDGEPFEVIGVMPHDFAVPNPATRSLYEATRLEMNPLGTCRGARPWLGKNTREDCNQPSRLLIRTASNAYFPQVVSVLSLPDRGSAVEAAVAELWDDLQIVDDTAGLAFLKKKPKIADRLLPFGDDEVLQAIDDRKRGVPLERPVKQVELEALTAVPEGFGDDVPVDPDFHARRLPDAAWRRSRRTDGVEAVIQVHRLREVLALAGFTRLEAVTADINGEYETDVERASLAIEPAWFPAVENRGEGVFVQLRACVIRRWLDRPAVIRRIEGLAAGHARWAADRKSRRAFPGGPYILLHTLSHLLVQSLAMRCGYPASSLRERIYADAPADRFGILLYTGSPDADGTLGGLVQQGRYVEGHLAEALRQAALCSNDPICARHTPGTSLEQRWLHGAACHGCALVAETCCEMRNDYLDRALVVPVLGERGAAFFEGQS